MQKKMVMIMTLGSYQRSRRQSILHSSPAIGHLRIPCLVQRRRSRATSPTEYNRNSGEYQLHVQSAASTFHLVLLTCDSLKGTMFFRLLVWSLPLATACSVIKGNQQKVSLIISLECSFLSSHSMWPRPQKTSAATFAFPKISIAKQTLANDDNHHHNCLPGYDSQTIKSLGPGAHDLISICHRWSLCVARRRRVLIDKRQIGSGRITICIVNMQIQESVQEWFQ